MRILIWSWHTPYVRLVSQALPEHEIIALPTPYAPTGWLNYQRPRPGNVTLGAAHPEDYPAIIQAMAGADVVIAQTKDDVLRTLALSREGGRERWPLYLAHNHAELDGTPPEFLEQYALGMVCISEMKVQSWRTAGHRGYKGYKRVISPGIPLEDYGGWVGDEPRVLTVCNGLRRPLFDADAWLEATWGLDVTLVGEGNGIPGSMGPAQSFDHLRALYRSHRVYLSVCTPPYEDGYNLALLEAMATGMPCVGLAHPTLPESVLPAEDAAHAGRLLRELLSTDGRPIGMRLGRRDQRAVAAQFPFERFAERWREVLEEFARV